MIASCPKCDLIVAELAGIEPAERRKSERIHCPRCPIAEQQKLTGHNSGEVKALRNSLKGRWRRGEFDALIAERRNEPC